MSNMLVITGTSGSGKSHLLNNFCVNHPNVFIANTETDRGVKERDKDSVKKYIQVSTEEFIQKTKQKDYFLEWKKNNNKYYGTPNSSPRLAYYSKKDIILDIDVKGAVDLLLRKKIIYDFVPKIFFLWREIYPLGDFREEDLLKLTERILLKREPSISKEELTERKRTALQDYEMVRQYKEKFIFLQNDGITDTHLKEFQRNYTPTFYPH